MADQYGFSVQQEEAGSEFNPFFKAASFGAEIGAKRRQIQQQDEALAQREREDAARMDLAERNFAWQKQKYEAESKLRDILLSEREAGLALANLKLDAARTELDANTRAEEAALVARTRASQLGSISGPEQISKVMDIFRETPELRTSDATAILNPMLAELDHNTSYGVGAALAAQSAQAKNRVADIVATNAKAGGPPIPENILGGYMQGDPQAVAILHQNYGAAKMKLAGFGNADIQKAMREGAARGEDVLDTVSQLIRTQEAARIQAARRAGDEITTTVGPSGEIQKMSVTEKPGDEGGDPGITIRVPDTVSGTPLDLPKVTRKSWPLARVQLLSAVAAGADDPRITRLVSEYDDRYDYTGPDSLGSPRVPDGTREEQLESLRRLVKDKVLSEGAFFVINGERKRLTKQILDALNSE